MSSLHLSVGVASLGSASALQRTLGSLLAQERRFDEIVVTHDGRSAETQEVVASHGDGVCGVMVSPELTAAEHWNRMAPQLTGDWVSLLTSEDLALPNYGRAVFETVRATPGAAILRGGWMRIRQAGQPGEMFTLHSVRAVVKPAEALFEQRIGPKGSFSAAAIRRDVWEKVGLFPAETPHLGDWSMWLLAGALGDTVRSREVLAEHRTPGVDHKEPAALAAGRKSGEMREMYEIYREILPRAAGWASLDAATWIASASRKRFRDVTIAASNSFGMEHRGVMVEALQAWADSVEQEELLQRFARGERIRDFSLTRRMKPALKRVISAVRS